MLELSDVPTIPTEDDLRQYPQGLLRELSQRCLAAIEWQNDNLTWPEGRSTDAEGEDQ